MQIRDFMTRDVEFINYKAKTDKAAKLMAEGHYGSLPVEKNDKLVGMVTDRDIVVKVVARGMRPEKTKVKEIMTPGVDYIYEDQSLEEAAQLMARSGHRRLPVMNREKRLVGIISIGDLAVHEDSHSTTHHALKSICRMVQSYQDLPPKRDKKEHYDVDAVSYDQGVVVGSDVRRW